MGIIFKILEPEPSAGSEVVEIDVTINSNIAMAFLASSITLSGGMLFVDADAGQKKIYVHCGDSKAKENAQKAVSRLEGVLKKVFE